MTIMITAVVVAAAVMMVFAGAISNFVARHPTMKPGAGIPFPRHSLAPQLVFFLELQTICGRK
jgi:hypothetical protein